MKFFNHLQLLPFFELLDVLVSMENVYKPKVHYLLLLVGFL